MIIPRSFCGYYETCKSVLYASKSIYKILLYPIIETNYKCSKSYLSLADAQRLNKSFRQQLLKNETSNFNYGESNIDKLYKVPPWSKNQNLILIFLPHLAQWKSI